MAAQFDPSHGERLLAVLGIRSFLARQHDKVLVSDHAAANAYLEDITAELDGFMSANAPVREPGRPVKAKPFDYLKLIEQLARPIQPADIENLIGSHRSGSDAVDLFIPLTRAIAYLNGAAPRRSKQGLFTAEVVKPSDQEIGKFQRAFEAVDNPMGVLHRMRNGSLLQDEVSAIQAVYPDLYGEIQTRVVQAFGLKLEANPKFKLSDKQERLVSILLQQAVDSSLVAALQATFADQAEGEGAAPPKGGNLKLKSGSFKTSAQATESGGK